MRRSQHLSIPYGARRVAFDSPRPLRRRDVDAPVSGGAAVAEAGGLDDHGGRLDESVFAPGRRPILECYGKTIVHIGPNGAGQVAKACNQICTIVNNAGCGGSHADGRRAGIDPHESEGCPETGFGASRMLEMQAPKMIARDFDGKVESRLHHKDIHIVLVYGTESYGIELPASAAAAKVLTELQNSGRRQKRLSGDIQRARESLTKYVDSAARVSTRRHPAPDQQGPHNPD